MKHFINLTNVVINKFHIVEIIKKPNKYLIMLSNNHMEGSGAFTFGVILSKDNVIEINDTRNPSDYKKITDWHTSSEKKE